jgi:hypothetical protein
VALPGGDGDFTVEVTDAVGLVLSAPAHLTVLLHPVITVQPTNRFITLGGIPVNTSFTVAAVSATPLRYRWLFNGTELAPATNITGLTNTTLTVSNIQAAQAGAYSVVVSDNYGSITSEVAMLSINVKPVFVLQPISQDVVPGGTASFSALWNGSAPMVHWWRKSTTNTPIGNILSPTTGYVFWPLTNGYILGNQTSCFILLTNISLAVTGRYAIVASNAAGQTLSAFANLTLAADTDGDGLPNSWENSHAGFSVTDPADGSRDDDGDGMSNLAEFIAGTDYLDPASYLKIDILQAGPARLQFNAVSNRTYTVQYSDGLAPAMWQALAIIPARTSTRAETVVDPNPATNRVYRLVTPMR